MTSEAIGALTRQSKWAILSERNYLKMALLQGKLG